MAENFSFLFQYLKKEKINIDQNEFSFQVQSHPNAPSLLAISDTFSFFKIDNLAMQIEYEDIVHLPDNFIALLKGESASFLAFIERIETGFRYTYKDKPIVVAKETFQGMFQNIVLLAEKEENDDQTTKKSNSFLVLILLGIVYLISVLVTSFSLLPFLIVFLASIGVYLSLEAISHEFGVKTKFSEVVCGLTAKTDCDAVINGKKSKFLIFFNLSVSSIVFFSAQLLALLFLIISDQTIGFCNLTIMLLLFCALPVSFISVYQQWFVAKKWCPICLAIIFVIYLELLTLLLFNNLSMLINGIAVVYYLVAIMACYLVTVFSKKIVKTNFDLQSEITTNNRFKRNYSLFKMALLSSDKVDDKPIISGSIVLGNPDAKLKIIVVSSPFCGHCKDVHESIENILGRYSDIVSIEIRFNFNHEFLDERSKVIHQRLVRAYFENGQITFMKVLRDWFENKDIEQLIYKEMNSLIDMKTNEILHEQFLWNKDNSITFTPAIIINGYHFPVQFDRGDLIYFINELVDDGNF